VAGRAGTVGGDPVSGAVISLFANGHGSFVAVSDEEGRFWMELPSGRYTLRALAPGLSSPTAKRVLIAAQRDLLLDVRFTAAKAALSTIRVVDPASVRELEWLVRHKRRSVLETQGAEGGGETAAADLAPHVPVEGSCWLVAGGSGAEAASDDDTAGASVVEVGGDLANARWSAGGVLPDGTTPAWRASAELRLDAGSRHQWRAVSAYAGRDRLGAVLGEGRWQLIRGVSVTSGVAYTYRPGPQAQHHLDPAAALDLSDDFGSHVRLRTIGRTIVAGGDPLTTFAATPAGALAGSGTSVPARRMRRHDLEVDRQWGPALISAHVFSEQSHARPGMSSAAIPDRGLASRGIGLRIDTRVSRCVVASLTYTRGAAGPARPVSMFEEQPFNEVVGRVEARLPRTRTRFAAYYRVHDRPREELIGRFDVQVRQGVPFLPGFSHSRWEVLLAVRNLVYESTEPGSVDELTTHSPRARVVAGLALSF